VSNDTDPREVDQIIADFRREMETLRADYYRQMDDQEEQRQNVMSLLKNGAVATVTITGLTLTAVFAFCGAIWANPSTPMLRVCANSLKWFGLAFLGSLLAYLFEMMTEVVSRSLREKPFTGADDILLRTTLLFMTATGVGYVVAGIVTLDNIVTVLHDEAHIYNDVGSVKSTTEDRAPVELKPFGEFCKPTRFGNFCTPD
jgi:hypothetical protein